MSGHGRRVSEPLPWSWTSSTARLSTRCTSTGGRPNGAVPVADALLVGQLPKTPRVTAYRPLRVFVGGPSGWHGRAERCSST